MTLFKSILYRGIPYLAFGYGSMFTNRRIAINKVWYVFDGYPVILKSYVINKDKPFRDFVIEKINSNPELTIEKECFDDSAIDVDCSKKGTYKMYSVYSENKNGRFYVGDIRTGYMLSDLRNFMSSSENGRTASVAKDEKNNKWCGWSHRAMACFGIGDRIFEEEYGDDFTPFVMHGEKTIKNEDDMILAAKMFANHIG